MTTTPSFYDVLGIAQDASAAQIKAAYRKAASTAHPDKAGGSVEKMQRIQEAYDCLSDPAKRAAYSNGTYTTDGLEKEAHDYLITRLSTAMDREPNDVIEMLKGALSAEVNGMKLQVRGVQKDVAGVKAWRGRVRKRTLGLNAAEHVVDRKLEILADQLAGLEHDMVLRITVISMLSEYKDTGMAAAQDHNVDARYLGFR